MEGNSPSVLDLGLDDVNGVLGFSVQRSLGASALWLVQCIFSHLATEKVRGCEVGGSLFRELLENIECEALWGAAAAAGASIAHDALEATGEMVASMLRGLISAMELDADISWIPVVLNTVPGSFVRQIVARSCT